MDNIEMDYLDGMDKVQMDCCGEMPKMKKTHMMKGKCCPKLRLAQAYVIRQPFTKIYCPDEALKKGTIFPNLYDPYK
ncbi:spore coat associated protein CotJA [Hathewaya histolytica]|uniref:spore coat associated protein CotJA n=1 Tax=Hathewaya histolytica TaxID=1498 RepID=UPI003B68050C